MKIKEGKKLELYLVPVKSIINCDTVVIPVQYQEKFMGVLYNILSKVKPQEGKFLHDNGYIDPLTQRRFKLFVFSKISPILKSKTEKNNITQYDKNTGNLYFYNIHTFKIVIYSVLEEIIYALSKGFLKKREFYLGEQKFRVECVNLRCFPEYKERIKIKTLSPITVYSTITDLQGQKKTLFYNPYEEEFTNLLIDNLNKKWRVLTGEKNSWFWGKVKPVEIDLVKNKRVIKFRNFYVTAWEGVFELELPFPLFQVAFGAGLGAKNSQGFGCIEEIEN